LIFSKLKKHLLNFAKKNILRGKLLTILFLFLSFLVKAGPTGPDSAYITVFDFKYAWMVFDAELKVFKPSLNSNTRTHSAQSLIIDLDKYPNAYLLIKSSKEKEYLFFEKKLYKTISGVDWEIFPVNSLKQEIGKSTLILSIYGETSNSKREVFIAYPKNESQTIEIIKEGTFLNFQNRNESNYRSSLVMIFILSVVMFSFVANNYTKAFKKYFNIYDLLLFKVKQSTFLVNKPLDRPNLMFVILLSILGSFILIICQSNGLDFISKKIIFQTGSTFGILITNYFKLFIIIFVSFIVKYFYIGIVGNLFNITKIIDIHYFKLIQSTLIFFSLLLFFLLASENLHFAISDKLSSIFSICISLFYILRTIIIYFTIIQTGNINSLYLISYLCVVEILPIVLGIRLII